MQIAHVALWAIDIDKLKAFYETYFDAQAGARYVNDAKGFTSYFLSFPSGARLELMARVDQRQRPETGGLAGFAHLAFSVGSAGQVDALTLRLEQAGYPRIVDDVACAAARIINPAAIEVPIGSEISHVRTVITQKTALCFAGDHTG